MSGARGQRLRWAALPLIALCAFGCGSSDSTASDAAGTDPSGTPESSVGASPTPVDGPDCASVWQEGATLPKSYRGCVDEAGALVERDTLGCSSGQRMVSHADRYWAVLGGTIHEATGPLADDPDYRAAVRSCRA